MKYNHIVGVLLALIAIAYGGYSTYAYINRVPSLEEMQADRNQKNQEVRDRCHIDSESYATGSTEREKIISARKWEDQCLQDFLLEDLNTNSGKYTGGTAPVPERINSGIITSVKTDYEHNQSTIGYASSGASSDRGQVLETQQAQGVGVADSDKNQSKILMTPTVTPNRADGAEGENEKDRLSKEVVDTLRESGNLNLLEVLGLDHCRITQNEDSHITLKSGHIYGTDIACEKGESFTVSAPQWKQEYTVIAVGQDKRLGDYIVLEHKNYRFVFAHTESPHKVGDIVPAGSQIGVSNKSGIATNVHLHFELWRDGYNITHEEMLGKGSRWNEEYSFKLLLQRGWYTGIEDAIDFISQPRMEGFSATSYEDPKGSGRWSIGFGTYASGPGETITMEEAKKRAYSKMLENMDFIYRNRLALSWNERIALSSFFYNLGTARPEMIAALKKRDMHELEDLWMRYVNPGTVYENGLKNRRSKEWSEFISK